MSLFGKLANLVRTPSPAAAAQTGFLPDVENLFGTGLATLPDFELRLIPALAYAIEYFDREIATIPGPFAVTLETLASDPFLATLFPAAADLSAAFCKSIEVRESLPALAENGHVQVHALMGMRCQPGRPLPDGPPAMADHTLRSLAPTEADTRHYLRLVAVDRLLKSFGEHVQKLRREAMESQREARELAPENMLRGLIAWLESPADHLRVIPNAVGWQWGPGPMRYELPTLVSADRRQWIVCLVRFPTQLGLAALQAAPRPNRYILI